MRKILGTSRWKTIYSHECDFSMSGHREYNSKLQPTRCNVSLFISTDALHVSGGSSAHHQEYWLAIPEAVCTVMCSWWWAEERPETCRASVEIDKSRNAASFWF